MSAPIPSSGTLRSNMKVIATKMEEEGYLRLELHQSGILGLITNSGETDMKSITKEYLQENLFNSKKLHCTGDSAHMDKLIKDIVRVVLDIAKES